MTGETEWKTRKKRIGPKLDAAGWPRPKGKAPAPSFRTEEEATDNGPADYAFWLGDELVGVVEAKKVTVGPQNVLTQAQRYSRGARGTSHTYPDGFKCPFLYSTNGEVFWFHDVRDPMNRSRRVAGFHTPAAFEKYLGHDFDGACAKLLGTPRPLVAPALPGRGERRSREGHRRAQAKPSRRDGDGNCERMRLEDPANTNNNLQDDLTIAERRAVATAAQRALGARTWTEMLVGP